MNHSKFLERLGAIDLGIVPLDSGSVDAQLASMSAESARSAKRKFRKLQRKVIKQIPSLQHDKGLIRRQVSHLCRQHGRKMLE
tara:strand:+ start:184 stop:432 length:249 start_codon:yes stop_codon:yes gene_type:complete